LEFEVQMRQAASQNTNVREGVSPNISPNISRGAIYLGDLWQEHIRPEIEAPSVEDTPVNWQETQVHWQGTRHVLGPSGYYVPDSSRARWTMGGKYKEGKEGVESAYEGFLELPPVVVVLVMWVAGVALLGSCALVLYMAGSVVVRSLAGSI
jgi:hypothetical protein